MLEALAQLDGIGNLLGYIIRILTITLGGIGVIYIPTRQLGYNLSKRTQHLSAMISMYIFSVMVTIVYHRAPMVQMTWETLIFWLISNVAFVLFADTLYARIDSFLDRKLGDD
jgi:hypothetical protein